jgi:hypothetical protein
MIPITNREKNTVIAQELEGAKWMYDTEASVPRRSLQMPSDMKVLADSQFVPCDDMEMAIDWDMCDGVPDYCTDKDEANRAILKMPEGNPASSNPADYPRWMFVSHLCGVIGINLFENGAYYCNYYSLFALATASPQHVTDALLLTLGYAVNMELNL